MTKYLKTAGLLLITQIVTFLCFTNFLPLTKGNLLVSSGIALLLVPPLIVGFAMKGSKNRLAWPMLVLVHILILALIFIFLTLLLNNGPAPRMLEPPTAYN